MNHTVKEEDGDYNQSNKYITFDENRRPIENISNPNQITRNIPVVAEYSAVYKSSSTKDTFDDVEKKRCQNVNHSLIWGGRDVPHKVTESGAAYAMPNKSSKVEFEDEDDKYIMLNPAERQNYVNLDPEDTVVDNNYESLNGPPIPQILGDSKLAIKKALLFVFQANISNICSPHRYKPGERWEFKEEENEISCCPGSLLNIDRAWFSVWIGLRSC